MLTMMYRSTLRTLGSTLQDAFRSEIKHIGSMVISSPAFLDHIRFVGGEDGQESVSVFGDTWNEDKLLWNISELSDFDQWKSLPMSDNFAAIDELIASSSSKNAARISQALYDWLSDLAALVEALTAIKYHIHFQPTVLQQKPESHIYMSIAGPSGTHDPDGLLRKFITEHPRQDDEIWRQLEQLRSMPRPSSTITEESIAQSRNLQEALYEFWSQVRTLKAPMLKIAEDEYDE